MTIRPSHTWTTLQVQEVARTLVETETSDTLSPMLKSCMVVTAPKDLPALFWVLDACIKLSPKFLHAVQDIVSALPESTQPQIASIVQHWRSLRLVPTPFLPRTTYGYFHWKRVHRQADEAKAHPTPPPVMDLASGGTTCAYCHDKMEVTFDDSRNDWAYVDGVLDHAGIARHVHCVDLMQIMTTRE